MKGPSALSGSWSLTGTPFDRACKVGDDPHRGRRPRARAGGWLSFIQEGETGTVTALESSYAGCARTPGLELLPAHSR